MERVLFPSMGFLMPLLMGLWACGSDVETQEEIPPAPWLSVNPIEPSPFRQVVSTNIQGAENVEELLFVRRRSLVFVRDSDAGRIHILDSRYRHTEQVFCFAEDMFPDEERRAYQQEDCADGEVAIHRGFLEASSPFVAMDEDSERLEVHLLTASGELYFMNVDLMEQPAFDYLRLPEESVSLGRTFEQPVFLRVTGNWLWVATESELVAYDRESGEEKQRFDVPAEVLDMEFLSGSVVLATTDGLWSTDGWIEQESGAADLFRTVENEVWAVYPDAQRIRRLGDGFELEIPGLTGPLAGNIATMGLWALAGDEMVLLSEDEGEVGRFPVEAVVDVVASGFKELTLLHADGRVSAVFDERQLIEGAPLSFVLASFVERPKSPGEDEPCTGGESNVTDHASIATRNLRFLKDLPAPTALGVTPHLARRAKQCGVGERLGGVLRSDAVEVGVLIHQKAQEDCAVDPDCYADFLVSNAGVIAGYGVGIGWASGMASHYESGADWVQGLIDSGVSDRFLSFGLSVLASVPHDADPRSKEVFPIEATDQSRPWTVSSAAHTEFHFPDGEVALYPGDHRASFNLGSCQSLLVRECGKLGQGGGQKIDSEDIEVLDLLLHRALAERDMESGGAWSFHLPDIGVWDYTEECEENNRYWTGGCGAGLLQDWLFDLHARFVLNGALKWSRPSELPWP